MRRLSLEIANTELVEWMAFYEVDALLQNEMRHGKSPAEALKMVEAILEITKH